jgi:hypothetical protein
MKEEAKHVNIMAATGFGAEQAFEKCRPSSWKLVAKETSGKDKESQQVAMNGELGNMHIGKLVNL